MLASRTASVSATLFTIGLIAGQSLNVLDVSDPRPLMAASDRLQGESGIAVNYEDPPFQFAGDIQDVTDRVQSARQRAANPNTRIRVPRGGRIISSFSSIRFGQPSDVAAALTLLRQAHEGASLPGRFKIEQVGMAVVVEPQSVQKVNGAWESVSSALSTPVSFPFEERTAADTLSLILASVTKASGIKVDLAYVPMNVFLNVHAKLGASGQTAKTVLLSLFDQVTAEVAPGSGRPLFSYRLLYDPGLRYYMLSVGAVRARDSKTATETMPVNMRGFGYQTVPAK